MRRIGSVPSRWIVGVVIATGALAVTGCAATPTPTPSTSAPSASATPTPPPTSSGTVLLPEGTAEENLPLFASIVESVAATDARYQGRAYIDALAAAGFDKGDMQVTNDLTTVGNPADSIQFSVHWAGECLVGQMGPSTPAPTALVLPLLAGDLCLIGQTRTIDW